MSNQSGLRRQTSAKPRSDIAANMANNSVETLKGILENSLQPERLDAHPWASRTIVQEIEGVEGPGQRLVLAIHKLFAQMMPSTPVKHGKRLDSRWAEFGILAALYFAPAQFGTPAPVSLRDAWGRIDQSILYYVYGKPKTALSTTDMEPYKLVGDEPEVASTSTLSDWHRKGLQRLADCIQAREAFLAKSGSEVRSLSLPAGSKRRAPNRLARSWRPVVLLLIVLLSLLVVGGLKAYRVYKLALLVRQDAVQLQTLMTKDASPLERLKEAGAALGSLHHDFDLLKSEVGPYVWIGPWLAWVPTYGGDLASAPALMSMAGSLLETADASYQALLPLLEENDRSGLDLPQITDELLQAQPGLSRARQALTEAVEARSQLRPETLTPELRDLILSDVDPLLPLLEDGLTIGLELPRLLGASAEGPKTYLLLVQNEDELRPTGGFITASGTLLLENGKIAHLAFSNSDTAEDWSKPYPAAPWQLQEYMNSSVLIFRDANWFVNYPTAARYAEQLYSYSQNHSVDGVIAFDQQVLVEFLRATGPIRLDGVDYPIDSSNVIAYMRAAKVPKPTELTPEWDDKAFINKITRALMGKIFGGDVELKPLAMLALKLLNQHHILVQVDNPLITSVLEKYHWDGAIRPDGGDFLMVVDTNVGFNKTNAAVQSGYFYNVDLTKTQSPQATLRVIHTNNSVGVTACKHWGKTFAEGEKAYPIQDCYWNYLRVFTLKGTFLLAASPQTIPADWMILQKSPPARVDVLDEESEDVQGFGTLQVVPGSGSLTTEFHFLLPMDVMQVGPESGQRQYRLKVQKQPGTLAVPITIRIQLPPGATVIRLPAGAVLDGKSVLLQTSLLTDLELEVLYQVP